MAQPAHEHVEPAHSHTGSTTAARQRTWNWAAMAIRLLLTLAGAAAIVISAFMRWGQGRTAQDISVRALWSANVAHRGNNWVTTLGFVLVVLAILAIIGLAPRSGWLTSLAGALGVAVFVLILVQVYRANFTVADLGPGAWLELVGSIVALTGGFFGTRSTVVVSSPAASPTVVEP